MIDKSLFKVEGEYLETINELEQYLADQDGDDDIPEEFLERLSINRDELDEKLYAYHLIIKQYEAGIDVIKAEKARLTAVQKRKERQIDYLKLRMQEAVKTFGDADPTGTNSRIKPNMKFTGTFLKATYQRQFLTVITDDELVPDEYKSFTVPVDLSKLDKTMAEDLCDLLNRTEFFGDILEPEGVIDNKAVNTALKSLIEVPGAELDTDKGFLRIY